MCTYAVGLNEYASPLDYFDTAAFTGNVTDTSGNTVVNAALPVKGAGQSLSAMNLVINTTPPTVIFKETDLALTDPRRSMTWNWKCSKTESIEYPCLYQIYYDDQATATDETLFDQQDLVSHAGSCASGYTACGTYTPQINETINGWRYIHIRTYSGGIYSDENAIKTVKAWIDNVPPSQPNTPTVKSAYIQISPLLYKGSNSKPTIEVAVTTPNAFQDGDTVSLHSSSADCQDRASSGLVSYTFSGSNQTSHELTLTDALVEGVNSKFYARAKDKAGNINCANNYITYIYDSTAGVPADVQFYPLPVGGNMDNALPNLQSVIRDGAGDPASILGGTLSLCVDSATSPPGASITASTTVNGTLSGGCVTLTASNAFATFTGIKLNKAGSYKLKLSYTNVPNGLSDPFTMTAGAPASVAVSSGNNQSGISGTALGSAFKAVVKDANSNVVSGVTVNWSVTAGGGSIAATSVSNASGEASNILTLGSSVGTNTVNASVTGIATPATFTATASFGAPAVIEIYSGNNQTNTVGTALSAPFTAVVKDTNNNLIEGSTVIWTVTAGAGTMSTATSTTNSSGRASSTLTLGTTAGTNTVTASVAGVGTPATFSATGTSGPATTVAISSGNNQNGTVGAVLGSAFVAVVTDNYGNPKSGITVNWSVISGGGSLSSASGLTDSSGLSSSTLTLGTTAGTNTARAAVTGIATPANFTATGNTGPAASITVSSGNGQSSAVGVALSAPFVAIVKDSYNNVKSGITVTWAITSGGGSLSSASNATDTSGLSSSTYTPNTTAGAKTITATATGVATPATYNVTTTAAAPDAAKSLVIATPATIPANNSTTATVTVTLMDTYNNVVSNKSVTLSSNSGGTITTSPATTNSSGVASFTFKSGSTGAATLTAAVPSDSVTLNTKPVVLVLPATSTTLIAEYRASFADRYAPGSNTSANPERWWDIFQAATYGILNDFATSAGTRWVGNGTPPTSGTANGPHRVLLDGTNDYIDFGNPGNMSSLSNVTVEAWILPTSTPSNSAVVFSNRDAATKGLELWHMSNGTLLARVGAVTCSSSFGLLPGKWYFASLAISGNNSMTLYVNGEQACSASGFSYSGSISNLRIGAVGLVYWPGAVAEMRIYSSNLNTSSDQHRAISAGRIETVPTAPALNAITAVTTTAQLSWTASSANTIGYKIYRSAGNNTSYGTTPIATTSNLSYNNTGLANGTYYYKILAYNAAGSSSYSNERSVVIGASACVAGSVSFTSFGTASWTVPANCSTLSITVKGAGGAGGVDDGEGGAESGIAGDLVQSTQTFAPGTNLTIYVGESGQTNDGNTGGAGGFGYAYGNSGEDGEWGDENYWGSGGAGGGGSSAVLQGASVFVSARGGDGGASGNWEGFWGGGGGSGGGYNFPSLTTQWGGGAGGNIGQPGSNGSVVINYSQ